MIKATVHEETRGQWKTTKPCNSPHIITTARRPDNIPLICTGAGPIHPVHSQPISLVTEAIGYISAIFPPFFKEIRETVQHFFTNIAKTARSKRHSRQAKTHVDNLLFQLVDDKHSMWNAESFLDRAQELLKNAINNHAKYTTTELDRSRQLKKERRQEDNSVNR